MTTETEKTVKTGGQAFPWKELPGMTLRDWLAAMATWDDIFRIVIDELCTTQEARYIHADRMLEEREK